MNENDFLAHFSDHKRIGNADMYRCPGHHDMEKHNKQSLQIIRGEKRWFVRCYAGCGEAVILTRAALTEKDLWFESNPNGKAEKRIVATYVYHDTAGRKSFRILRFADKDFLVEHLDAGGVWRYGLGGEKMVLFNLPQVLQAIREGKDIFICSGEKDVENTQRFLGPDVCCTTNPFGESKGKWLQSYSEIFRGFKGKIRILEDNDGTGRAHCLEVAQSLHAVDAKNLKIIRLPGLAEAEDISDRIAAGHTKEETLVIVEETPIWTPDDPQTSPPTIGSSVGSQGWEFSGAELVSKFAAGDFIEPPSLPLLGQPGYIIEKWSHLIAGYPKAGKTELLIRLVLSWLLLGFRILFLTEEPESIWGFRLQGIAGDWTNLRIAFGLGKPPGELFRRAMNGNEEIVILDTLRNLLGLEDETNNSEVARVLNPWIAGARSKEKTLIMAHHMRKGSGEHGEGIAGGHALLAVFDVALEILHDTKAQNRRLIRAYKRLTIPSDLLYEKDSNGNFVALGDPQSLGLEETCKRVEPLLTEEWLKTKEIQELLEKPRPSVEQVRQALLALARKGVIDRNPPISEADIRGKTPFWRKPTSPPTEKPTVGREVLKTIKGESLDGGTEDDLAAILGRGEGEI